MKKSYKEEMAQFFEKPTREGLRKILKDNVGEFNELDFKSDYPIPSKLAKQILALSNSGGGALILGVYQNENNELISEGIKLKDKTQIGNEIEKYLPQYLPYDIIDFSFSESEYPVIIGKKFQVIIVEDKVEFLPFVSKKEGDSIQKNTVYIRRNTECQIANYEELQKLINRRIDSGYNSTNQLTLTEHCDQLKILYSQISKGKNENVYFNDFFGFNRLTSSLQNIMAGPSQYIPNNNYPKEDFEEFINRMIEMKKTIIERILKSV